MDRRFFLLSYHHYIDHLFAYLWRRCGPVSEAGREGTLDMSARRWDGPDKGASETRREEEDEEMDWEVRSRDIWSLAAVEAPRDGFIYMRILR